MQRPPYDDANFVQAAVEEEVERDEEDYDIYLLVPSLELSSPSEEAVVGPCLYGPVPYLLAYDDFYDRLYREPTFPNWHEEPIDFRYPEVSNSDSSTQMSSTLVPEYSNTVKSGLLFTVSCASSWRQRVNRVRRRIHRMLYKVRGLRRRRPA